MKRRYKVINGLLALLAVAATSLALAISYDSDCVAASPLAENTNTMKAVVYRCYGAPDVLSYEDVEKPTPADNEVLVRIRAAAVNPLDWHYMRGSPYLMRLGSGLGAPTDPRFGVDFAGTIEAVGKSVTRFQTGDDVFGGRNGAFAEYVTVPEDRALALKPANVSFEQAASVPIAAVTALQALRDSGKLASGQKVLINGASGGVGTFAVQIAKSFGADVSGVCSERNTEMVRSLGADRVFDYRKENYTESGEQFDLIVDNIGNHSLSANRGVLKPDGKLVIIGGPKGNWLGPLVRPVAAALLSPFVDQQIGMMLAQLNQDDLATLADLMEAGLVTPVIDRRYSLSEVREAIRYSEEGHARGKIVINLD